jgi:hypothetical protein
MRIHVAKADMLLFQDDFNKQIFPFHRWVRRLSSGVRHCLTEGFTIFLSIVINLIIFYFNFA